MTKTLSILVALLLGAAAVADARAAEWRSADEGSELLFTAYYEGEALAGRFQRFRVALETDDETGEPRSLVVEVQTGSADMRDREINEEIGEPDWFDVETFPTARYESQTFHAQDTRYMATGRLRLKGVERALEIPLELEFAEGAGRLTGAVRLSRLDWQIGTGEWSNDASLSERVDLRWNVRLLATP